jgi:hypothetical protein
MKPISPALRLDRRSAIRSFPGHNQIRHKRSKEKKMKIARICAVVCAMALVLAAAGYAQQATKVAGKWEMTTEGPQGTMTSTMVIEQDGEKIKGKLEGPRGEISFEGSIKGNQIAFTVKRQSPQGEVVVEYSGKVEGDTMKGTRKGPRGETEWSAKRAK